MSVIDEVAGGAALRHKTGQDVDVADRRLNHECRRQSEPATDDADCELNTQRPGEDGGMGRQSEEGEDNDPRESHALLLAERGVEPSRARRWCAEASLTA